MKVDFNLFKTYVFTTEDLTGENAALVPAHIACVAF